MKQERPRVVRFQEISSTQDVAVRMGIENCEPEGLVVVAQSQTAGRGRDGRRWESPQGGVYLSVLVRPTLPRDEWPKLTQMGALAATDAVSDLSGLSPWVKLPNDIMVGDLKVGGVLATVEVDREGKPFAVLGIGINWLTAPSSPTTEFEIPAGAVCCLADGACADLDEIVSLLTKKIFDRYKLSEEKGAVWLEGLEKEAL